MNSEIDQALASSLLKNSQLFTDDQETERVTPKATTSGVFPHDKILKAWGDKKMSALGGKSVPNKFNHYVLKDILGSGNYGLVFSAYHEKKLEAVAIKLLVGGIPHPSRQVTDPFTSSGLRELHYARRLKHKNIMQVLEVLETPDFQLMVMPRYPMTLTSWIGEYGRSASHEQKLQITKQLLEGVGYIHEQAMMHRDLKTDNIMVKADNTPVIIDLGLCRELGFEAGKPFSNEVLTEGYRPLEVVLGGKNYDQTIDIWALGTVIYMLFTGQPLVSFKYAPQELDKSKHAIELFGLARICEENEPTFDISALKDKFLDAGGISIFLQLREQIKKGMHKSYSISVFKPIPNPQVRQLLQSMLQMDPSKRVSTWEALDHECFKYSKPEFVATPKLYR